MEDGGIGSGGRDGGGGRDEAALGRRETARRRRGGVLGKGLAHRDSDGARRRAGGGRSRGQRGGIGAVGSGDGELGRLRVDHIDVGAVDGVADCLNFGLATYFPSLLHFNLIRPPVFFLSVLEWFTPLFI